MLFCSVQEVREVLREDEIEGQRSQPARSQEPQPPPTLERRRRPQGELAHWPLRSCDKGRGRGRLEVGRTRGRTGQLQKYENCSYHYLIDH